MTKLFNSSQEFTELEYWQKYAPYFVSLEVLRSFKPWQFSSAFLGNRISIRSSLSLENFRELRLDANALTVYRICLLETKRRREVVPIRTGEACQSQGMPACKTATPRKFFGYFNF